MPVRRELLVGALAAGLAPAWVRQARAADVPRFELGIASGFPRPDSMVLWTMLTGASLPERAEVHWEVAHDEAFRDIVARGSETAESSLGAQRACRAGGPGAGALVLVPLRGARPAQPHRPHAHGAATRRRGHAGLAIASCQRWDHGHYAAWRHMATQDLDLVAFLGDYIYEYPSPPSAPRRHEGGLLRTLDQYRARYASTSATRRCRTPTPPSLAAGVGRPRGRERLRRPAGPEHAAGRRHGGAADGRLPGLLGTPALPEGAAAAGTDMRITGRLTGAAWPASWLLDDRQYRDPQACPKPGRAAARTPWRPRTAPACRPTPQPAGRGPGTLAGWCLEPRAALEPAGPADADGALRHDPHPGGRYWTDGWDGYPPPAAACSPGGRAPRARRGGAGRRCARPLCGRPEGRLRRPTLGRCWPASSAAPRSAAAAWRPARIDAALPLNPHILACAGDQRGYVAYSRIDAQAAAGRPADGRGRRAGPGQHGGRGGALPCRRRSARGESRRSVGVQCTARGRAAILRPAMQAHPLGHRSVLRAGAVRLPGGAPPCAARVSAIPGLNAFVLYFALPCLLFRFGMARRCWSC
jgi:alkaline phosphatase D